MDVKFLDAVKSFIKKIVLRLNLRNILNFQNIHIHIGGTQTTVQNNILSVPLDRLNQQEQKDLSRILGQALADESISVLGMNTSHLLEYCKSKRDAGQAVLEALRGFVDSEDIMIMRSSFYIRAMFEEGKDIAMLKSGVIRSFGARGRKICNLCSAGYFENMIVPTLMEMRASPDFQPAEFTRRYELIVGEEAFSLFVHSGMSAASLAKDIAAKLERNKSYGKRYVNIHAISQNNIATVIEAVSSVLQDHSDIEKVEESRSGNSIFVKLETKIGS